MMEEPGARGARRERSNTVNLLAALLSAAVAFITLIAVWTSHGRNLERLDSVDVQQKVIVQDMKALAVQQHNTAINVEGLTAKVELALEARRGD